MLTQSPGRERSTGTVTVSVVVATRNRPMMLNACLASLRAAVGDAGEIIVVDSASDDADAVRVVSARYGARYLRCDEPGASLARNRGWRAASGDVIAFVDDDVRVAPTWAASVAVAFAADPAAAFVTGRIDVPPEQAGAPRPVALDDRDDAVTFSVASVGPIGHGANAAFRRAALEEVGGFDEQLGPGRAFRASEDYDLFDRVLGRGHRGRYEPGARAWHDQWRAKRQLIALDWAYGIGSGARLAKLVRTDRRRLRAAAATTLWVWGLRPLVHDVRTRYKLGVVTGGARLAGVVFGFVAGIARPVRGGHYRGRSL